MEVFDSAVITMHVSTKFMRQFKTNSIKLWVVERMKLEFSSDREFKCSSHKCNTHARLPSSRALSVDMKRRRGHQEFKLQVQHTCGLI